MTKSTNVAKLMMGALVFAFSLGVASHANAIPIFLDQSSIRYLGLINDGIPPDPDSEVSYINHLISMILGDSHVFDTETYFRSSNACAGCGTADTDDTVKDESESPNGNFGGGYTYLLAKYDASQAGSLVWDVRGLTGDFEVQAKLNNKGISHWSLYKAEDTDVPEPMTLTLLGVGLAGLGLLSKRRLR